MCKFIIHYKIIDKITPFAPRGMMLIRRNNELADRIGKNMVLQSSECEKSARVCHGSLVLFLSSALCSRAVRMP